MKKTQIKIIAVVIYSMLFISLPFQAGADGGVFYPPASYTTEIGQRAIIFYDQGVETMILSTDFEGNAQEFGWIIPTPTQPEVDVSNNLIFEELADFTYPQKSTPAIDIPFIIGSADRQVESGVTILETKEVGDYEITVLKAGEAGVLLEWLSERGFVYPPRAVEIFNEYMTKNWVFTALKINSKALAEGNDILTGHVQPIKLTFNSDEIIYPMKITRAAYFKTISELREFADKNSITLTNSYSNDMLEVDKPTLGKPGPNIPTLLYVFSDHKKTVNGLRIVEGTAQHKFDVEFAYIVDTETINSLLEQGGESMRVNHQYYLTKLYREVHISNIENDLTFINDSNNEYVNEPSAPPDLSSELLPVLFIWVLGAFGFFIVFMILKAIAVSSAKHLSAVVLLAIMQALFVIINVIILISLIANGGWNILAFGIPLLYVLLVSFFIFKKQSKQIRQKRAEDSISKQ